MFEITAFSQSTIETIGWYIYCYSDPRTQTIFYVGKGSGNRCFDHLNDKTETRKTTAITAIRKAGLQPKIEIISYGLLDEGSAFAIEMAVIETLGLRNLTNEVSGHNVKNGRILAQELELIHATSPLEINQPAILIRINRTFGPDISEETLYHVTRGTWKLSPKRAGNAKFALAVYKGLVREVYVIEKWHHAGSTIYPSRSFDPLRLKKRYEFTGQIAPSEYRDAWIGKKASHLIPEKAQNPIRYVNCPRC